MYIKLDSKIKSSNFHPKSRLLCICAFRRESILSNLYLPFVKLATIKFDEYSNDNTPLRAKFIAIRDYE